MSNRFKVSLMAAAALALSSGAVNAAPIECTGGSGSRILILNTEVTGTCFATGLGNLGDPSIETLTGSTVLDRDAADSNGGLLTITGEGSDTGGTWSLFGSGTTSYLYFHFGNGPGLSSDNPDWFVFALDTITGIASGTWSTNEGANWMGLSNVALLSDRPTQVPEPATLALLGLGLCGIALARRRKQARAA